MKSHTIIIAALAGLSAPLRADLVAYEGFNGYAAGALSGQTINSQTVGLNTATSITSAGTGGPSNVFQAAGMTFSDLIVSGGSGLYSDVSGRPSYIGFAYNGPEVTGNLYTSYLVNLQTAQNTSSTAGLRVNATSTSGGASAYFNSLADSVGGTQTANQYDNVNNGYRTGAETLATNTVYLVLGRFTRVGQALSAADPGVGTTFVLTAAQFDFFKTGGITDAKLDVAAIGSGPGQVTSRISDFPVTSGMLKLASGNGIQFGPGNANTAGVAQTISYDEFRMGTTLADVTPFTGGGTTEPVEIDLTVTSATASEPTAAAAAEGNFRVTRAGSTDTPLFVNYAISGSATNGTDYPPLTGAAIIPAGATYVDVSIRPYTDSLAEGDETVTLTLTADESYILPAQPSGTVTIGDRAAGTPASRSRFVQKLAAGIPQRMVVYGTSLTANGSWPAQVKSELDGNWPGLLTLINSGGSGMASDWGAANHAAQVVAKNPDVVFIEFSVNDAVARFGISLAQARANLETIIDGIHAALPQCEIILQVMNPVTGRPEGDDGWRPDLAFYQQVYRDVAAERDLLVIDHMPAWQALLDEGEPAYLNYVPDGLHPSAAGQQIYETPVILQAIGVPLPGIPLQIADNNDVQSVAIGTWTSSTATAGYFGGDYLLDGNVDKGTKSFRFSPEIGDDGIYSVYLRWTAFTNRATNVPVTVNYDGGATTLTVDQTKNGGRWVKLGDLPLAAGSGNSVLIETTGTNGFVVADAVGIGTPSVTLRVDNGRVSEDGGVSRIVVTRRGPLTESLAVNFDFGGEAVNGVDYQLLPETLTIPAGAESARLEIRPTNDGVAEGPETLTVELFSDALVDQPYKASLVVVDAADSPFQKWQLANFNAGQLADPAISGPDADPDADGLGNLLEYFAGLQPLAGDAGGAFAAGTMAIGDQRYLTLNYRRGAGVSIGAVPEATADLLDWNSNPALFEITGNDAPATAQTLTVRYLTPIDDAPKAFLRLRVPKP